MLALPGGVAHTRLVTSEEHPELAGYETGDRPLRGRPAAVAARVFGIVALCALVLPGILVTIGIQTRTATSTCIVYTQRYVPDAMDSSARLELFAPLGPGWQCYAVDSEGDTTFVAPLGIIPSAPRVLP